MMNIELSRNIIEAIKSRMTARMVQMTTTPHLVTRNSNKAKKI
ncbi:MAG: hypothetical protein CLLPBCKN_006798 [Chroococcidiopsis cubana SAG 39.79]|nr:hypothetical protein [Chroococcidiopsis cubana SAG 39.79]